MSGKGERIGKVARISHRVARDMVSAKGKEAPREIGEVRGRKRYQTARDQLNKGYGGINKVMGV